MKPEPIDIEPLSAADVAATAQLVGRVMATTPIHAAVFAGAGATLVRRQQKTFELILRHHPGTAWLAKRAGRPVGFCRTVRWPACQAGSAEAKRFGPAVAAALGPALPRVQEWVGLWGREDPPVPHWHLGPVVVDQRWQGRGIGSRLLERFCAAVDANRDTAYLETDSEDNVRLYERFGFMRRGTAELFGVTSYFMWRGPRRDAG